ncbi:MAG: hypothetical protein KAU10_08130, partial [Dehalococcoidia bacterium]|nr:hypothetical protein [Dehalococcoidia bacterium]
KVYDLQTVLLSEGAHLFLQRESGRRLHLSHCVAHTSRHYLAHLQTEIIFHTANTVKNFPPGHLHSEKTPPVGVDQARNQQSIRTKDKLKLPVAPLERCPVN